MSAAYVDVLVVTSTPEELGGVLALGDNGEAGWSKRKAEDGSTYHVREFENARGKTFVMATTWAGTKPNAEYVARLAKDLAPNWITSCGVCNGFEEDASVGDILVANQVIDCREIMGAAMILSVMMKPPVYPIPDTVIHGLPESFRVFRWSESVKTLRPPPLKDQERWLLQTLHAANQSNPGPLEHPERRIKCPNWSQVIDRLRRQGYLKPDPGTLALTLKGTNQVREEQLLYPDGLPAERSPLIRSEALGVVIPKKMTDQDRAVLHGPIFNVRGLDQSSADLASTAQQLGKPFLIIKTIVDYPGRDPFPDYVPYGVRASAECLLHVLQHIFTPEERSVPMGPLSQRDTYLQSITIENFKNIHRLQLDFSQNSALNGRWTCIAGVNGAGKSAILQAITMVLLGDKLTNDLGLKLVPRTMRITPEGRLPAEIRARVRSGNDDVDLFLPIGADGVNERLLQDEPGYSKMIDFWSTRKRGHVLLAYGAGRNLSEYVDKRHKDKDDETQRQMTLFDPLAQVASVDVLLEQDKRAKPILDMLKTLLKVVLKGTELSVEEDESKLTFRCSDVALPAFELPDGFRSTIAWLADICATWIAKAPKEAQDGDPSKIRGIVLIDEIDLHLHASLQRVLVPNLRKALPHVQWIVTTHSPLVVASFDRHEIVLLQSTPEGPQRKPLDRQILGFSSDEVYQYLMGTEPHSAALEDKLAAGNGGADLVHILAQSPTVNDEKAREQRARLDALAREADDAEEKGLSNEDDA